MNDVHCQQKQKKAAILPLFRTQWLIFADDAILPN